MKEWSFISFFMKKNLCSFKWRWGVGGLLHCFNFDKSIRKKGSPHPYTKTDKNACFASIRSWIQVAGHKLRKTHFWFHSHFLLHYICLLLTCVQRNGPLHVLVVFKETAIYTNFLCSEKPSTSTCYVQRNGPLQVLVMFREYVMVFYSYMYLKSDAGFSCITIKPTAKTRMNRKQVIFTFQYPGFGPYN